MTVNIINANDTRWVPISSEYPYDENLSLIPTEIQWRDGYKTVHHPIFEGGKDVSINNDTSFYLSNTGSFFDIFNEISNGTHKLGCYVTLAIDDMLITEVDSELYVVDQVFDRHNYFKLTYNNTNDTVSLIYGNQLYFTVSKTLPYQITLEPELDYSDLDRQQFNFDVFDDEIMLQTNFTNIFYYSASSNFGPTNIKRYISYDKNDNKVKAVGIIPDDDYSQSNTFLLGVSGFNIIFEMDGLTTDQTWVKYYNDLTDRTNNLNANIDYENSVSAVKVNRLVDTPFKTQIDVDNKSMAVNLANLKNTMTASYEYRKKN